MFGRPGLPEMTSDHLFLARGFSAKAPIDLHKGIGRPAKALEHVFFRHAHRRLVHKKRFDRDPILRKRCLALVCSASDA